ncbi:MAG: alpha-xylosidase [Anaerolineae bacterium]|nr:alpha-xylosidase [Anaerolineae bacterium]CAG1014995.1 alpha-glucosidase [Anaerolineae bacterium]
MKFNHGHWELLPGVKGIYPTTLTDVSLETGALVISGYDHEVRSRNDYIHGTLLTLRFTAPMPDVIRVQVTHQKARRVQHPAFDLNYELTNPLVVVGQDETHAWLKSGSVSVVVPLKAPFQYAFQRDGEYLTGSAQKGLGLFIKEGETYLREQLSLLPGETVYGFGERFGTFVKNGQTIEIWNEDCGTDNELSYKNVPFYLTNRGYGVLVNHPGWVSFEVASHFVNGVQFAVAEHKLDYYLFGGPTPKDVLGQYTALSGRPALLPDWSFGLWLSTSFTTNYNEQDILAHIERMESLGIPVGVFHFDCFWMKELTWCSLLWDERYFPDPVGMLKRIKAKGVKICLWINPYIAETSALFDEGAANDYFLHAHNGDTYQQDYWQPGIGFVDFTNPAARSWYASKLKTLVEMGVDAFKTDFGELIPTDVRYHDGSNPERMHNYYTYLYNQTVFDLLKEVNGEGQAVVFARSATCGNQKFPLHWGGDNSSTYPSMAETLRGGLSLGLSGFGYWSHDISGFVGTATPDLYKRWVAFGLLSSHSRLHGNTSVRMPWTFDDESVEVLRFFNDLKAHLMPYLLDMSREAHDHGLPMLRAMMLEFPDDPTCKHLDMQYMLGSSLLVAPIFDPNGYVLYYLPQGEWRNLFTGTIRQGGVWIKEQHGYFSLPLWVRTTAAEHWQCLTEKPTAQKPPTN